MRVLPGILREDTIMRHRRKGRKLGRNPNHQRALLRSLASALILTEREAEGDDNKPKIKGRIVTTIQKAKEVRPLVERVVTIAIRALPQIEAAARLEPAGERNSEEWKKWRHGPGWAEWNKTIAPVIAARRQTLQLLGSKQAVQILFSDIAPASPAGPAVTPACCAWPSHGWAMPACAPSWSLSARTIASVARR